MDFIKNIKKGREFAYKGCLYKITHTKEDTDYLRDYSFLAIYIGNGIYRDLTTYNGHIKYGDFRTDNALFEISEKGEIKEIQEATGIIGIKKAKKEYKKILGFA